MDGGDHVPLPKVPCRVLIWEAFHSSACDCTVWGAFPCFKQNILYCFPFPAVLQTNTSSQKMQKQPLIDPSQHLQKPCQEIVAAFYTRVPGNKGKFLVPSKYEEKKT